MLEVARLLVVLQGAIILARGLAGLAPTIAMAAIMPGVMQSVLQVALIMVAALAAGMACLQK